MVDIGATGVENCENQWRRWAPEDLAAPARGGGCKMWRILKFVASSFVLDFILLTEGSIPDPCYEIWE